MYAIVDIETTGGFAGNSKITEIAIIIYDGEKITDQYETILNPQQAIPGYITGLTGITPAMVAEAPTFMEVADEVYKRLKDKIFVAHNVHFDYSFIKRAFEQAGYIFAAKKLCTVRLSRQIIPNQRSYSLGNLCAALNIPIENRHRAGGDAKATTILFGKLLNQNPDAIRSALKRNSKETTLPPNLPKGEYLSLPEYPGVYYFIDSRGEVIYVGKAVNIKKRVASHFSGTSKYGRNQYIRNEIHHVSYELTGNDLVALVLESQEIKRLWPKYNRAQKHRVNQWGIYHYEDRDGYIRLNVGKRMKGATPLVTFNNHADGFHFLMSTVRDFTLCPKLSGIQKSEGKCFDVALGTCKGACQGQESAKAYNQRVALAMASFQDKGQTFAILGEGRNEEEHSIIIVENSHYQGFGFFDRDISITTLENAKLLIQRHQPTTEITQYIQSYVNSPEAKLIAFTQSDNC